MRLCTYKTRLRGFGPPQPTTVGFVRTEPHFNGAARWGGATGRRDGATTGPADGADCPPERERRSEEHTSELQSLAYLVCRLLLEKQQTRRPPPPSAIASAALPLLRNPVARDPVFLELGLASQLLCRRPFDAGSVQSHAYLRVASL